jgi:hypothetical protein
LIRRTAIAAALLAVASTSGWGLPAPAVAQHYDPADAWQGLPEGEGREEVFYTCVACHSMATVMQQRLSRRWWELTIERMVDDMGMAEPDAAEREVILDYLEEHFGQDSPR